VSTGDGLGVVVVGRTVVVVVVVVVVDDVVVVSGGAGGAVGGGAGVVVATGMLAAACTGVVRTRAVGVPWSNTPKPRMRPAPRATSTTTPAATGARPGRAHSGVEDFVGAANQLVGSGGSVTG
jgi:hypothetical protein